VTSGNPHRSSSSNDRLCSPQCTSIINNLYCGEVILRNTQDSSASTTTTCSRFHQYPRHTQIAAWKTRSVHQHHPVREAEVEADVTATAAHSQATLTEVEVVAEAGEVAGVEEAKTTISLPTLEGHLGAASVLV